MKDFQSLKAFSSWVLENKNKIWQYNYFTDEYQKKNQGNIVWPVVGQIYIRPLSDTTINVYYLTNSVPAPWRSPDNYLIEFYHCQLSKKTTSNLRLNYNSHETAYWDGYFKEDPNLFVFNPYSFKFLNWNQDPFEVKL